MYNVKSILEAVVLFRLRKIGKTITILYAIATAGNGASSNM